MITTMEALDYAISILNEQPTSNKNTKMIAVLTKMKRRDVFIQWDKKSIIEALMKFKEENGYAPTTRNLQEYGMPSPVTIQSHFHTTPSVFLKQLFPELRTESPKPKANIYGFNTEQDWLNCFAKQFNKHLDEDMASKNYNHIKDKDTPTWETIARHCNINGWLKLMEQAGVKYPNNHNTITHITNISIHSPSLDKLEQINKERQRLNDELLEILSYKK